jgi:hypothetical protein
MCSLVEIGYRPHKTVVTWPDEVDDTITI